MLSECLITAINLSLNASIGVYNDKTVRLLLNINLIKRKSVHTDQLISFKGHCDIQGCRRLSRSESYSNYVACLAFWAAANEKPLVNDWCCTVVDWNVLKLEKKLRTRRRHILWLSRWKACQPVTIYKQGGAACLGEHHYSRVLCGCVHVQVHLWVITKHTVSSIFCMIWDFVFCNDFIIQWPMQSSVGVYKIQHI